VVEYFRVKLYVMNYGLMCHAAGVTNMCKPSYRWGVWVIWTQFQVNFGKN